MTILSRRKFLHTSPAAAAATLASPIIARAQSDTIKVGGLHDLSGALDAVVLGLVFGTFATAMALRETVGLVRRRGR